MDNDNEDIFPNGVGGVNHLDTKETTVSFCFKNNNN